MALVLQVVNIISSSSTQHLAEFAVWYHTFSSISLKLVNHKDWATPLTIALWRACALHGSTSAHSQQLSWQLATVSVGLCLSCLVSPDVHLARRVAAPPMRPVVVVAVVVVLVRLALPVRPMTQILLSSALMISLRAQEMLVATSSR